MQHATCLAEKIPCICAEDDKYYLMNGGSEMTQDKDTPDQGLLHDTRAQGSKQ